MSRLFTQQEAINITGMHEIGYSLSAKHYKPASCNSRGLEGFLSLSFWGLLQPLSNSRQGREFPNSKYLSLVTWKRIAVKEQRTWSLSGKNTWIPTRDNKSLISLWLNTLSCTDDHSFHTAFSKTDL